MAGAEVVKLSEQPKEFSLDEVNTYLRKLQQKRSFGEIKIKCVNGRFVYIHRSCGMNPGDPLE